MRSLPHRYNTVEPTVAGSRARRELSSTPLVEHGAKRLRKLCEGVGFGRDTSLVVDTFRRLLSPWGDAPIGRRSGWISNISDDHTPIEFSVAMAGGRPEVRFLFEPQPDEPTLSSQRVAGLSLVERLGREFGADLSRLRRIEDLFLDPCMSGTFAVWSAAVFSPGRAPQFKVYLNPQARGQELSRSLVKEAIGRLGLREAWGAFADASLCRGHMADEIKYFSLDLASTPEARVKLYVNHHVATPEDLEHACSAADGYIPGDAIAFTTAMTGGRRRLDARSAFTCSNFVSSRSERPVATTLYIPACAYAHTDEVVRDRVCEYLADNPMDRELYRSMLRTFADRPLDAGVGMQSWTAIRRYGKSCRLTVYLATEAKLVYAPGAIPAATQLPLNVEQSGVHRKIHAAEGAR